MTEQEYFLQKLKGEFTAPMQEIIPFLIEDGYLAFHIERDGRKHYRIAKPFMLNGRQHPHMFKSTNSTYIIAKR